MVRRHPAAELRGIPDMPVARDQPAHAGHRGEPLQAGPVVAERVILGGVQQRDLDVGEHVSRDQNPGIRQEHRGVPRRVAVMDDDARGRAVPGDAVRALGQRHQAAEQFQVVPGRRLLDSADQPGALVRGDGDRPRRRVPGHVARSRLHST